MNIIYAIRILQADIRTMTIEDLYDATTKELITKPKSMFILNLLSNHWALLTNVNCSEYSWNFYDSLMNTNYLLDLKYFPTLILFLQFNKKMYKNKVVHKTLAFSVWLTWLQFATVWIQRFKSTFNQAWDRTTTIAFA